MNIVRFDQARRQRPLRPEEREWVEEQMEAAEHRYGLLCVFIGLLAAGALMSVSYAAGHWHSFGITAAALGGVLVAFVNGNFKLSAGKRELYTAQYESMAIGTRQHRNPPPPEPPQAA